MINRISSVQVQSNRMQTHQNKQAKPAFGTAYHIDVASKKCKTLLPQQENKIILNLVKKAKAGEFNLENVYFFSKYFKSQNGGRVETKIKTMQHFAYTDLFSPNGKQRIQIVKDKNMDDATKESYDTLAKILEAIEPKK